MNKGIRFLAVLLFVAGGVFAQNGSKRVNLNDIVSGKFRQAGLAGEMQPMPDGEHYTMMNSEQTLIIKYAYRTGEAVDTLFNVRKARESTIDKFEGYAISSTGHRILVWNKKEALYRHSFKADVYYYDVRRNMLKPLNESGEKVMIPTFSPDGRMCAFVQNNDIWLKKFDYDTEVQVTKDGALNKIINGATDWVYEEEFATTNLMTWSSNSEYLAYVRFDESELPVYSMQIYGEGVNPEYYNYKYPKAGARNSKIALYSYSVETKDIKELKTPMDADGYIPRIAFTSNPEQLAVLTLNRNQNIFSMHHANPKSGVFRLVLKEENKRYIDSEWLNNLQFTENGFLYVSEKDGYAHIYQYTSTGVEQKQVTKGNWDVTRLIGMDEATQTVYFESAEESPLRRTVYKVDGKGVKTKLSKQEGTNQADFSANFAYYVNRFSNAETPMSITLNESKSGKVVKVLQSNSALKENLGKHAFAPKEFTRIQTASGYELNAWVVKPADFKESKQYPVVMFQYSGPNSQSVLDQYEFGWEQYLAANGFICICVDGRGTGARGEEFRKTTYLRLGELESRDQIEAAKAISKLSYIDKNRISIWGWSFGGYTTLMAMSTGDGTFKAGIAVAPPTDWRYYDTVYTERYMRTPKENEKGYNQTSPIKLAGDLQGKLLLIHGTADDNVHLKQTMDYTEALVQAGKQFDMHIYKDRDHGISGGNTRLHLYTKMTNYLFDNL